MRNFKIAGSPSMTIRSQLQPGRGDRTHEFHGWLELMDEHGILARAEVEADGVALEVAIPRVESQSESRRPAEIFSQTMLSAKELATARSVRFIRTVVRDDQPDFAVWEAALVRGGFRCLSAKRLWTKEGPATRTQFPPTSAMGVEI